MNKNFIDILQTTAGISEEMLQEANQIQQEKEARLSDILIENNILTESQLLEALSMQYDIPFWPELPLGNIGNDFTDVIPIQFLKKYTMIPLGCDGPSEELQRILKNPAKRR